jgi:hypothetical protein
MPKKIGKKKGKMKTKGKTSGRMPNELIVFPNDDKKFDERWEPGRSIANFPRPFRMCNIAGVSCGKTNLTKNIICHASPQYDRICLIHLDPETLEYDDLDLPDEDIFMEIPDIEEFNPPEPDDPNEPQEPYFTLIIIEDMSFKKGSCDDLSKLFRYISSHKLVSVILNFQRFTDIPLIARNLTNVFNIYKVDDLNQADIIGKRIGFQKGQMADMCEQLFTSKYDFLTVDRSIDTPYPLRLSLFKPIRTQSVPFNDNNSMEQNMLQ